MTKISSRRTTRNPNDFQPGVGDHAPVQHTGNADHDVGICLVKDCGSCRGSGTHIEHVVGAIRANMTVPSTKEQNGLGWSNKDNFLAPGAGQPQLSVEGKEKQRESREHQRIHHVPCPIFSNQSALPLSIRPSQSQNHQGKINEDAGSPSQTTNHPSGLKRRKMTDGASLTVNPANLHSFQNNIAGQASVGTPSSSEQSRLALVDQGFQYNCDNVVKGREPVGINSRKVCNRKFATRKALDDHQVCDGHIGLQTILEKGSMVKVRSQPVFICDLCHEIPEYYDRLKYQEHLEKKHHYKYKCTERECTKLFLQYSELCRHLLGTHGFYSSNTKPLFMWYKMALETSKLVRNPRVNETNNVVNHISRYHEVNPESRKVEEGEVFDANTLINWDG